MVAGKQRDSEGRWINAGVIWLTGFSGAGKTTLANALVSAMCQSGMMAAVLDGDALRRGLCGDLGFSPPDRSENIRRIAEVAHLMCEAGLMVVVAAISPFAQDRAMARSIIGTSRFFEVWLDTPLSICEQRDAKGLYQRARCGQVKDMTGIDSPYEVPDDPQWVVDGKLPVAQSVFPLWQAWEAGLAMCQH